MKTLMEFILTTFLLTPLLSLAQPPRPSAILVMLSVESRKISFYEKNDRNEEKLSVIRDAKAARMAMVHDFSDHFSFCPVYYFMDTNFQKVINGEFEGVLLNKELRPVVLSPIVPGDTSYLIVNYGNKTENDDPNDYTGTATVTTGLIVTNYQGRDIKSLRTYIPKKVSLTNKTSKYRYSSKDTDISYFDLAGTLNNVLERAY